MTPKKDIVRKPTYTLPDGTAITASCMGPGFTLKEAAFIAWYTNPGSEAFMNAGRAAVRAGYKPGNAVMQGYLLRQKPRIAGKIKTLLDLLKPHLHSQILRIAWLCRQRMFFKITDFYRNCKRIVKIRGVETEIDSFEIIPLDEISYENRMCIDGITYKGPHDIPLYILPDREKAYQTFMKCYKILIPENGDNELDWKATAEIIRGDTRPSLPSLKKAGKQVTR